MIVFPFRQVADEGQYYLLSEKLSTILFLFSKFFNKTCLKGNTIMKQEKNLGQLDLCGLSMAVQRGQPSNLSQIEAFRQGSYSEKLFWHVANPIGS